MASNFQILNDALGGIDGGAYLEFADGFKINLDVIYIKVDADCSFSTLIAIDRDGSQVNMVTENNLSGKILLVGTIIGAPEGGYISEITLGSGSIQYFSKTDTSRGGEVEQDLTLTDSNAFILCDSNGFILESA